MVTAFLFAIITYRLLLFIKFNTKIFSFSLILCKKCIFAPSFNLNQGNMGKILNYKILGTALKSLSDVCFKADEQMKNGFLKSMRSIMNEKFSMSEFLS